MLVFLKVHGNIQNDKNDNSENNNNDNKSDNNNKDTSFHSFQLK